MTIVQESIIINATREQIRPFFFDPAAVFARDANVLRYEPDADWPAVGAKNYIDFKTILTQVNSVATSRRYDPQTMHLEYESVATNIENSTPSQWLWTFDEQDGRTTVGVKVEYHLADSLFGKAFDRLVVERQNRKQTQATLAGLKQQVEAAVAAKA